MAPQQRGGDDPRRRALAWLGSYPKCSRWFAQYADMDERLEAGGGICRISNFLPGFVAEGALAILEGLPLQRWNDTAAEEDYTHNNIAHRFFSCKAPPAATSGSHGADVALEALLRAFSLICPDQLNAFSAGRYERGHHIAPHDDRAYTQVRLDTGEVVSCSRDLTCVYHLTKDWTAGMGGAFVDLEAGPSEDEAAAAAGGEAEEGMEGGGGSGAAAGGAGGLQHPAQQTRGRLYVPEFNSAVFFRVPRYHAVTPLRTDRPRFSIFGWFLHPGSLYELFNGQEEDIEQQIAYRQRRRSEAAEAAAAGQPALLEAAAAGGGGSAQRQGKGSKKQRRRQPKEEEGDGELALEAPMEPHQCKLAQRLLARAAAKRARKQQQQAGE